MVLISSRETDTSEFIWVFWDFISSIYMYRVILELCCAYFFGITSSYHIELKLGYCWVTGSVGFSWEYCAEFSPSSCTDCISGEVTCSNCGSAGLCSGVELDFSAQPDVQACADQCANFDGCEWYSYDSASEFCILTPDCDEISSSCSGPNACTHGEKSCSQESQGTYPLKAAILLSNLSFFINYSRFSL